MTFLGRLLATEYGVPQDISSKLVGGNFQIGKPFLARRIGSFHITEDDSSNRGYSPEYFGANAGSFRPSPVDLIKTGGNERFVFLTTPQKAERISAFSFPDEEAPQVQSDNEGTSHWEV